MTTHAPQIKAYPLPAAKAIGTAAADAMEAANTALDRLGRVMAVVTAAAVRDILTNCDPDAPFDATHVELRTGVEGCLYATGWYWTADGSVRLFANAPGAQDPEMGVVEMNEWVSFLNESNSGVWVPLVEELRDPGGFLRYRFDLTKAAGLPLD